MSQLIIIDANSLVHRAYHALPRLTTPKGEASNAVYGFTAVLLKVLRELNPKYIAAAFDIPAPTFREEAYEEYKAQREKAPEELYAQIPRVKDVLAVFNIPFYEQEGFEADDVIGTIANTIKDHEVLIVSGDLDTLQLVNGHTKVYTLKKGIQDTIIYDEKAVEQRFGLRPDQLADFKGLRGDPSDNIPGVPGVGEKTASQLLQQFDTIENLYKKLHVGDPIPYISERVKTLLLKNEDQAMFSKMLATIRRDVPVSFNLKDTAWRDFDRKKAEQLFLELGFKTLISRLPAAQQSTINNQQLTSREQELYQDIEQAREAGILSDQVYQLERDLAPVILAMEQRGIKIDKKQLEQLAGEIQKKMKGLERQIYKAAGRAFNINSPQQLSLVLFDQLQISPRGLKKTPGGEISTAAPELEKIREAHKVIPIILDYRELQKLFSTYIKPLPDLADANGRVHTTYRPLGTETGRLTSRNPNLQNIPARSELGRKIRSAFVAEKGNLLLSCDYSQMELRVIAHLAEDQEMIQSFREDKDIHRSTAARIFGVSEEEVDKDMRFRAKALNFGLIYGIGPAAFAKSAGISREEADDFMQRYMQIFSGVASFMERIKQEAHHRGYVETLFGRRRYLPDLRSPNPGLRSTAERAAINMPVQGTAADIVKMAMVAAHKQFPDLDLLLQVHDELLWEGEASVVKREVERVKNMLENIVSLSVPLKVDVAMGSSWGEI